MISSSAPLLPDDLEVVVGPLRRRHLRSVMRIEQQVYPRPWSARLFTNELAMTGSRVYLGARVDGALVGYGGLMLVLDDGHITTLAVDPQWHRHKIGTRLLLTLAHEARAREARNLTLEVRAGNAPAQALYRRFGFAPAGVRRGYYTETNEDALVMWANDIDGPEYAGVLDRIAGEVPGRTRTEPIAR